MKVHTRAYFNEQLGRLREAWEIMAWWHDVSLRDDMVRDLWIAYSNLEGVGAEEEAALQAFLTEYRRREEIFDRGLDQG